MKKLLEKCICKFMCICIYTYMIYIHINIKYMKEIYKYVDRQDSLNSFMRMYQVLEMNFLQISQFQLFVTQVLVQFSSVAQLYPTLSDPMNHSTPGLPVHHQLLEFTQTHIHGVSDAIQPFHPLSSPSPPTFNVSQHQCLF